MNTTSRDTSVNRYWDMLKDLGVDSKLALIHRLNDSIVVSARTRKKKQHSWSMLWGLGNRWLILVRPTAERHRQGL